MIVNPRMGRLTQGSIFCGGRAMHYQDVPVWGLIITARCDTVHDKVSVVNYLPVVRVDDWIRRHGGVLVLEKSVNELRGKLKGLLKKRELSDSLLDVYTPKKIAELYFPLSDQLPSGKKEKSEQLDAINFSQTADQIELIDAHLKPDDLNNSLPGEIIFSREKDIQSVINDLLTHKVSGYYYLPEIGSLTEQATPNGYVVLLREVRYLSRQTAKHLVEGISEALNHDFQHDGGISFDSFDFVSPVAELQSPWIEHLMQVFCTMFGRIGVEDADKSRSAHIASTLCLPLSEI